VGVLELHWNEEPPAAFQNGAVAIGNFDGVHLGHQALLAELRRQAGLIDGPAVAVTFDPHPMRILKPESYQPALSTMAERTRWMQHYGADHVVVLVTNKDLLSLSPEEFFNLVIEERLAARTLVEGFNFRFGRDRLGTIESLGKLCRHSGRALIVVRPIECDGANVASSRVRRALLDGDVRLASELLGRPYRLQGTVVAGQGRGRSLGFPTANLGSIETLLPADGVYAVRVEHAGFRGPGAANIGPNPTFGETARKVEVHLIGYSGDLMDQLLVVEFIERLRDTRAFNGPEELKKQLQVDIARAKEISGGGQMSSDQGR
jgi:riboflavin kinase/FMN adenylyltransferase